MAEKIINNGPPPDGDQSVLPDDIVESIALGSFCSITGQPSSLSNLAYSNAISNNNLTQQNTVANQQAMNQVGRAVLGSTVNLVSELTPMEAVASVKLDTGNDVAEQLMDLKAASASGSGSSPHPPTPPLPPLPKVTLNASGKVEVSARRGQFPLTFAIDDMITNYSIKRDTHGATISINSKRFPINIYLPGQRSGQPSQTITNVSRGKFPVNLHLGGGSGPATVTESPSGTMLIVNKDMFPVELNVTP